MSRRIVAALAALVVIASAAFVLNKWVLNPEGTEVVALFDSSIGLYPGSDVEVLGVPVGTVTAVEPEADKVRVTMELDHGQEVSADTAAVLIAPTVVSDRFIQLTKPYDGGSKLASGTVIPLDRTAVPVEIDDLYQSLEDVSTKLGPEGANANGALSDLLEVAAANLDGQGRNLNVMIEEFSKATATLSDTGEDFFSVIENLDTFSTMLLKNDQTVALANKQFAEVTGYLADDRDELSAAITNLADAMVILDDFIRDNRGNLKSSVDQLIEPTQVLVKQKKSLEETVRLVPLLLQNFLKAYDKPSNTIDGRGNLNELTLWSGNGLTATTSDDAPPALIPPMGGN